MTHRPLRSLKQRLTRAQAARRARKSARRLARDPQRGFVHAFISKNMMGVRDLIDIRLKQWPPVPIKWITLEEARAIPQVKGPEFENL